MWQAYIGLMNPLISVNAALLPVLVFGLAVGSGRIGPGAWLGAALACAAVLWHRTRGKVRSLELTILATLAAIAAAVSAGAPLDARAAVGLGFLGLALGTGASVLAGRPWTADYSRGQYAGAAQDPLFLRINTFLSGLWSLLFAWLAFASFQGLGPAASWVPSAAGSAVSFLLPRYWVRRSLQRRLDAQAPYRWPAPDFAARRGGAGEGPGEGQGKGPGEGLGGAGGGVDFDVIVVGAGIGGLTAGALLAQAGLRVLVAEQHSVPGGFAHNWTWTGQDGENKPVFRFDSGVHDVSGVWDGGPVHGILTRLGLREGIEWKGLQHRYVTDGRVFDVPPGWDAYVQALAARHPADADGIRRAMADIRTIFEAMYSQAREQSGIPGAPDTVEGLLAYARQHPLAVGWMDKPFAALLQAHIRGADARAAVAGLAGYITHDPATLRVADMVPLFGYYLHGGCYPVGGSGVLAQALADAIALDGGEVRLETPVAQVLADGGAVTGVRLANGQMLRASAVVMNADFLTALDGLIDTSRWPQAFRHAALAMAPACSAFGVHLGVRGGFDGVPPVIHVRRSGSIDPGGQGVGIVIPSQVDPGAAPEGYSTVEVLCLLSHEEAREWFDDPELTDNPRQRFSAHYQEKKRALGDRLVQAAEQVLPGLAARIVCRTEASPLTFRRYNWSRDGAIYGKRGAPIATHSPLPGLVFAGAATHGAGIEAVVISGAMAAEALVPGLLRQNSKRAVAA